MNFSNWFLKIFWGIKHFNFILNRHFLGCSEMGGDKKAKYHTYPTMIKLDSYTLNKEGLKNMRHVTNSLSSANISIFHQKSANFPTWRNRYKLHFDTEFLTLLTFFQSLKIVLINMVKILVMSTQKATIDLLKIKIFWDKSHDIFPWGYWLNFILWLKLYFRFRHMIKVWWL